MIMFNFGVNYK